MQIPITYIDSSQPLWRRWSAEHSRGLYGLLALADLTVLYIIVMRPDWIIGGFTR